jgi:hypothetical protein
MRDGGTTTGGGRLTADDARDLMGLKRETFGRTLVIVRHMCDAAIKDAGRRGRCDVVFDVPASVWGRETYDQREMGTALARQLYEDGFDVTGTNVRLHVHWGTDAGRQRRPEKAGSPEDGGDDGDDRPPKRPPPAAFYGRPMSIKVGGSGGETGGGRAKKVERRINVVI